MSKPYRLLILTPEKKILEEDVYSAVIPGAGGYLEILADHAPIIAALKQGNLTVTATDNRKLRYTISGGVCEMIKNQAVILAQSLEVV